MIELFAFAFFQRAILVGIILGIVLAILGVFVVLRRLSFFSDAIGHSALTGIALGLLLHVNPFLTALLFSLFVAMLIVVVRARTRLATDTILGVFFSAAVAVGVILVYLTPGYRTDLLAFLFGDIITVGALDVFMSIALSITVLIVLWFTSKSLVSITLHTDLARAEGVAVNSHELIFLLLLAGAIALSIKLVGIVLVTALIVIPAASALNIARSLTALFILSVVIGLITVVTGMTASAALELPSGPMIVVTGALFFGISLLIKSVTRRQT